MPGERTPAEKVFDQLSSAPIQHPASARLFADWLLQAGDVVTVTSGNEAYQVPVYNMEMTWKGSPIVEVDATGSKERPPLPALARRSYGGSRAQAEMEEDLDGISSQLVQQNDKIGLVVTETSGGNVIRAASIMAAINDDESSVTIDADKIEIYGTLITQTQQGWSISAASGLFGSITMADAGSISGAGSIVSDAIYSDNIYADNEVDRYCLEKDAMGTIRVVDAGSNQYKIQKQTVDATGTATWTDIPNTTFSRAATASVRGIWSGGTFTVSATDGAISPSTVETTIYGVTTNGAVSKQTLAGMINVPVKVVADVPEGGDYDDGTTVKTQTLGVSVGALLKGGESYSTNGTKNPPSGYIGFSSVSVNVTLNDPTWNEATGALPSSRTYTVKASTGDSKSQTLYLTADSGSLTAYMRMSSTTGTQLARVTCNDSNLTAANIKSGVEIFGVTGTHAGAETVTLNNPTWSTYSGTGYPTHRTYTVEASNGASKSQDVLLYNNGMWSSGETTVYMSHDTTGTSNRIAALKVSMPSTASWNSSRTGQSNLRVTCTVGGKSYTSDFGI